MNKLNKILSTSLILVVLLALTFTVAYAATTFTQNFVYQGDTYTMKHIYTPGTSSWNAYVRSQAPRTFSYLGGNTWAQRRICGGVIVNYVNRGGWANYGSSAANSTVYSYAYATGTCSNQRMGIYALHQWQDYGWGSPINHDYTTSMAKP
ncbi:MAG TPA: hypothetical protein VJ972_13550 [Anaerolineales bacterium]|nr:hypothetical protein [Anaerolineales bacterium]